MVLPSNSLKNLGPALSGDPSPIDRHPLRRDDLTGSTYSVISGGDVEEGLDIEFIIRRSGALTSPGEVKFQVKSGSAKIDEDFTAAAGYQTISFPALASNTIAYQDHKVLVPTISEDEIEIDESLIALLRPSSSLDRIQDSMAQAKILNDDVVSRYSLSSKSTKVTEGAPFELTINRTSSKRPATITLSLKGSGADLGSDVEDIGEKSIVFPKDVSSIPYTLNTTDDTVVEIPEGFFARIDSDSKADQIDKGMLYLEIKDNDVPSQYSLVKPEKTNEGDSVQFKVKRTGNTTTDGAFYFWTKNATAKSADIVDSDSVGKKQKIIFPKGVTEHTVSVQTFQDYLVEDEEIFYGFIKPFHREDRVLKGSQKAVIVDNDRPVKYSLRVLKGVGTDAVETKDFKEDEQITFEITRSETGAPGSVRLKLRSATAREKVDFTPPKIETVEFGATEDTKIVTVPIIDDTIVENKKEMFFASLRTNDRADIVNGSGKNQEITILDNDTVMSYELSYVPLKADDGSGTLVASTPIVGGKTATVVEGSTAMFRITRSGGDINSPGKILFKTMAGSAKDPKDFVGQEKKVINFDPLQTQKDILISTVSDVFVERDETFSAVIRAKNKQDRISNSQQLVTIDDNDEPAAFSITADNSEATEGEPLSVTITKTGGEGRTSSVLLSTSNNRSSSSSSARSGKDYEKNRLQLDFGPNDASTRTIAIPTFDDSEVESDKETFFVNIKSLSSQDSHGYNKDSSKDKSKVKLTIVDNDEPAVFSVTSADKLDNGEYGIDESNPFAFTISKTGGEGRTSSVIVSTSNGSARSGADYEKLTRETIKFAPDEKTKTISIPTLADEDIEGGSGLGEDFYVDVRTTDTADSISGSSDGKTRLDVTIVDDDKPAQFSVSADKSSVDEGELITFTVTKTGGENRTSSVVLSTSNGSAKWGRDYERTKVRLDFSPTDPSTQTFTIQTVDDQIIENKPSADEEFYVDIQAPDSADSITGNKRLEFTITDNDQPAVFSVVPAAENQKNPNDPDEITVDEAGSISFTVNRTGGGGRTTAVLVSTKNGSAKSGSDYVGKKVEYVFGPNDTAAKTLTIPISPDERIEGGDDVGENFSIRVKPLDSADSALKSKLDVTIVDNDEPAVFSVSADKTEVEEGGSIGFTISKSGGQGRTSSVVVSTSNGSAKWGRDYERLLPTQIDFAANETSKSIPSPVKTLNDELNEKVDNKNENFYFDIKPLSSSDSVVDGQSRLELTIADPVAGGNSQIV